MNVLLTGSTSFVGKHLTPLLEADGHIVYHLVRSAKGFPREIIWDFQSPIPPLPPCSVIIHLASVVNFNSMADLVQYQVNTVATVRLALFAAQQQAYLIFASSVGIYGSASAIDRQTPICPPNGYTMSKYLAEEMIRLVGPVHTILRIAGIYGLDGPEHLGLNTAITNAVYHQRAPTMTGSGEAKRNYICVNDVALWIVHLLRQYGAPSRSTASILYLAGPQVYGIGQYLQIIVDILVPGATLNQFPSANTAHDCIVERSQAPFTMTSFESYLESLQ